MYQMRMPLAAGGPGGAQISAGNLKNMSTVKENKETEDSVATKKKGKKNKSKKND